MNTDVKVYFDTEFTGLRKDTDLISIGMIANDPYLKLSRYLYLELNDYDQSKVNDWIQDNVINNLIFKDDKVDPISDDNCIMAKCNKAEARDYIRDWLKDIHNKALIDSESAKVQLVSDVAHYDFVLFLDLFGTALDLPDFISPVCLDINNDISKLYHISPAMAFDHSREYIIQILDGFFVLHNVPSTFDDCITRILPKKIMDKKHNSLYDAYIINKLDAYMHDAEELRMFK